MTRRRIPDAIPWIPVPLGRYRPTGRDLSPVERAILGAFLRAWVSGEDGHAISQARLAGATGYGETAIKGALRTLRDDGLLELVRTGGEEGRGDASTYRLALPGLAEGVARRPHTDEERGRLAPPFKAERGRRKGSSRAPQERQEEITRAREQSRDAISDEGFPTVASVLALRGRR